MALALIAIAVILGLAVLPQMWVRSVIARNSQERSDLGGIVEIHTL